MRDAVMSAVLSDELMDGPSQVVLMPSHNSNVRIPANAAYNAYTIDDPDSPVEHDHNVNQIVSVLETRTWEPSLAFAGYSSRERSVWLLQLDLHPFWSCVLENHFLSIRKLITPNSVLLVTYIYQDVEEIAKKAGFRLVSNHSLADSAVAQGLDDTGLEMVKIATLMKAKRPRPPPIFREVDELSDITKSSNSGQSSPLLKTHSVCELDQALNKETHEVHLFEIVVENVPPNAKVMLVGNAAALGKWDITRGVTLTTDSTRRRYSARITINENIADIQYKFAVVGDDGNVIRWDEEPMRTVRALEEAKMRWDITEAWLPVWEDLMC